MDALPIDATGPRHLFRIARHLEIDSALDRVQFNVGHNPRRLQAQRGREQGVDSNTHQELSDSKMALPSMVTNVNFHWKWHRASLAQMTYLIVVFMQ